MASAARSRVSCSVPRSITNPSSPGDPGHAQQTQRVVVVDPVADRPHEPGVEVGAAAVGIDQIAARERQRHGVDREVAQPQVLLDGAPGARDVDGPRRPAPPARRRGAPTAETASRRPRRARPRAAEPGSPSTITSMSATGRPTSRSRTLPPTSHAPSSGTAARIRSSSASDDEMLDPPAPRRDVGDDLVADRVRPAGPLMRADRLVAPAARAARPRRRRRRRTRSPIRNVSWSMLMVADDRPPPPAGEHVHPPGQQPRDAVRVAGRARGRSRPAGRP